MNKKILVIILLITASFASAQQIRRFNPDTIQTVVIDSAINIRSHRLDAQDFINTVLADTGFYQAFRDMKKYSFTAENYIYTYDKKNRISGRIYHKIRYEHLGNGHKTVYLAKSDSGDIHKANGRYRLYTLEMFEYIFNRAYNSDFSKGTSLPGPDTKNQSYKDKLKTLIFAPGHKVTGIPFISSKSEIFSQDMRQFYLYQFARGTYLDSIPVYRFRVIQKPSSAPNDVVIKELTTIFDMRNFQILGRYVNLSYHNLFFSFDVKMNIELTKVNGDLVPAKITYQGTWDIPFHKTERASFLIVQNGYKQ